MNSGAFKAGAFAIVELCRAAAAFLVVFTHYWANDPAAPKWWLFTHTGVDFFFVITGYVFAPHLFGGPIRWRPFLIRRFFRIYPSFLLALLCYFMLAHQDGRPLLYVTEHLTFNYLQSREMAFYYNPAFWSLPSEIAYYLLLPALAWILGFIAAKPGEPLSISGHTLDADRFSLRQHLPKIIAITSLALGLRTLLAEWADFAEENIYFLLLHHLPGLLIEFMFGSMVWLYSNARVRQDTQAPQSAPYSTALWCTALAIGMLGWGTLAYFFGLLGDHGILNSWLKGKLGLFAAASYALVLLGLVVASHDERFEKLLAS